jgi:TonB family protein
MDLHFAKLATLAWLSFSTSLFGQDALPTVQSSPDAVASTLDLSPMPTDPTGILSLAARTNGLRAPGVQPWHVRGTYQVFNSSGASQTSGIYEEVWISDKQYKRSYTSSAFSQTDFATPDGIYRVGNQSWPAYPELLITTYLTQPVLDSSNLGRFQVEKKTKSVGKAKYDCVTLKPASAPPAMNLYCFEPNHPALRVSVSPVFQDQTVYNDVVVFQNRFLARSVGVVRDGHTIFTFHIDEISALSSAGSNDLAPPTDAVPVALDKIVLSQETMNHLCIKQVPPMYPSSAKASHITGKVVMLVTVGKDGHVLDVKATAGPAELQRPAIDALRMWEFQPFLVSGEPVNVESTLQIIFSLGG